MKKKKVETKEVDTGYINLNNSFKNNDNENRRESNIVKLFCKKNSILIPKLH